MAACLWVKITVVGSKKTHNNDALALSHAAFEYANTTDPIHRRAGTEGVIRESWLEKQRTRELALCMWPRWKRAGSQVWSDVTYTHRVRRSWVC